MRFLKITTEKEKEIIKEIEAKPLSNRELFILKLISDGKEKYWSIISQYNRMSEDTINKNLSILDVSMIQVYQKISADFVVRNIEQIEPFFVTSNRLIDNKEYEIIVETLLSRGANPNEINWIEASSRGLDVKFVSRFRKYMDFAFMYYDYQNIGDEYIGFIRNIFPTEIQKVKEEIDKNGLDGIELLIHHNCLFGISTMNLNINQEAKTNILVDNFVSRFMSMEENPNELYSTILRKILNKLYKEY